VIDLPIPRHPLWRALMVVAPIALASLLLWWRGPDWGLVYHAFDFVTWRWIVAAYLLNLVSVLFRALSWRATIDQALDPPDPRFGSVLTAYGVGLLANAALPGRIGELARVAVLRRHLPEHGPGTSVTLVGTVVAHRIFDVIPALLLFAYVLATAKIPHWALTSLLIVGAVGLGLFAFALASAKREHRAVLDELGRTRRLWAMVRQGLAVMKEPVAAVVAIVFQSLGWLMQLLAVWIAMRAFDIDAPLPAAGLVLLLMNVATIFPLWPGNIGLVQAAVAFPLVSYGVAYSTGFAYGIALQAVELSVAVSCGLVSLAVEGITFATLRLMPDASGSLEDDDDERTAATPAEADEDEERAPEAKRTRAGAGVSR
jgi:uncharacterized protein (TIRG00374 family)